MRNQTMKIRLSEQEGKQFQMACDLDNVLPAEKGRELLNAYAVSRLAAEHHVEVPLDEPMPQLATGGALRVGEMFSGPGGIGVALNRTRSERFSFTHSWATDWDSDTCRTYATNVLKHKPDALCICKDVRELDIDMLPVVDGFLYGFPCNDFSLVGESKGLHGQYGGLYSYGVRYIERANPLFFFC